MVTIKKREIKGKTYFYLSHTYALNGKKKYKETYLGTKLPNNTARLKKEFTLQIYKEKWFGLFDSIRAEYQKQMRRTPSDAKKRNMEAFLVRFTYDTSRIEGSKLSLKDTAALLGLGLSPKNRPISDIKETEAHRDVFYEMINYNGELSLGLILRWHKELFSATKSAMAGRLRDYNVYISGSDFTPPPYQAVESYASEFFKWYSTEKDKLDTVELAAIAHLRFETAHPFGDGNGRIGRLIMNFILHKNGYPMLDIRYTDRASYYNALERSNIKNDEGIFVQWFFKRYLKESKIYLGKLQKS
ncbi:MAG: Fic family protein [Candidatus Micrarchaeota archaeon]|nr:Fic family protein [Candidatus Micrarchaeota archaeon]MDE1847548.1 Fic family protein [Candidatus Micrarchaeota archaeon]MDE1864265.1 Fic family protein [Candidatus Micrarchaeota archaeon]